MQTRLLRPEDYLHDTAYGNYYWNKLIRTVDEFDQLMHIEQKQITKCIQELQQKKGQLTRQFTQFKESLRLQGDVIKRELQLLEGSEVKNFFPGYHQRIGDIIEKVLLQPQRVCQLLLTFPDAKRISFEDFLHNLVFNLYPCYLAEGRRTSLLMRFIKSLLKSWPYDVDLTRPAHYSLIDQALSACMKAPAIVCYVERIVSRFLRKASKCHMNTYAFDGEAVHTQIHSKKQLSSTLPNPEPPKKSSWRNKFRSFFGRGKEEEETRPTSSLAEQKQAAIDDGMIDSVLEVGEEVETEEVMRMRQRQFLDLVAVTIETILQEDVPLFLCQILACFNDELTARGATGCRMRHYCYFLMTNIVLAQLHNKFTISYQDSTMTHAHLQNISQIIKLLNCVMQGLLIEEEKYHQHAKQLNKYQDAVRSFYSFILERGQAQADPDEPLLTELLLHYQGSPIVSLNDLAVTVTMLKHNTLPGQAILLDFLKNEKQSQMFEAGHKQRTVKYKQNIYPPQHIYFQHDSKHPHIKEVTDYYLTADQPLQSLPLIRELLIEQSNLPLQDALEIQQECRVAQKIPLRELKGFIERLAHRYPCLRLKDGRQLQQRFQIAFRATLSRSLQQKQWLLYYRSELTQRLTRQGHMIQHFTDELNSAQFYERMATAFMSHPSIKIHLSIQNDVFVNHESTQGLHRLHVAALMQRNRQKEINIRSNQNFILRNSFKTFNTVRELIRCLGRNQITKAALFSGRRPDQFNKVFQEMCEHIVLQLKPFLSEKKVLQSLSEDKLAQVLVRKMQDQIVERSGREMAVLEKDKQLLASRGRVDKERLWDRQLGQLGIDKDFLVAEGAGKFKVMMGEKTPAGRVRHFGQLLTIIFTVMGFTMTKSRMSAGGVNPVMQYLILCCAQMPHHQCLLYLQMDAVRCRLYAGEEPHRTNTILLSTTQASTIFAKIWQKTTHYDIHPLHYIQRHILLLI